MKSEAKEITLKMNSIILSKRDFIFLASIFKIWIDSLIKFFFRKIIGLMETFQMDNHSKQFIKHNRKVWKDWKNKKPESLILHYCHSISQNLISSSYFVQVLAKKNNSEIVGFFSSKAIFPKDRFFKTLIKIYRSFNTNRFLYVSLSNEQEDRTKKLFETIIVNIKNKKDVFDISIMGVPIGIAIYESYLQKFNRPTVYLDDPKLFALINEGIGTAIFWNDFFENNNVSALVISHDCNIPEDIPARIAYKKGIPVYLPDSIRLRYADRPHTYSAHFNRYREIFKNFSDEEKQRAMSLAKNQIEKRLKGEVGVDMIYSTESAFKRTGREDPVLRKNNKIKILIATHCFYDNPHGYGGNLFLDFHEWLHFLGRISEITDYDWYIKTHPNSLPGTEEIIENILDHYPKITVISSKTSHHQLAEEGLNFVLTVYGTVGHEYPFLGVQVINAGHNPHVAFNFNWHPKSLEEYEYLLLNLDKLHKEIDKDELYEFYYMNYYYAFVDDLIYKSQRQLMQEIGALQAGKSLEFSYFLDQLDLVKHKEIIENTQRFIESGKTNYFEIRPYLDFG
jgi:hypothetical protein